MSEDKIRSFVQKFLKENADLMNDLAKAEDLEKKQSSLQSMPEGWNRLRDMRAAHNPLGMKTMDEGVQLMKEMAEALEKGIRFEDCPPLDCDIYGHNEMRAALKKFKEWK